MAQMECVAMTGGLHSWASVHQKAVEGRHWRPDGQGFAPKVSPLMEALIGETGTLDVKGHAVNCWSEPPWNAHIKGMKGPAQT